jgi:hypothetical protein
MKITPWALPTVFVSLGIFPAHAGEDPSPPGAPSDVATQREDEVRRRVLNDFRDDAAGAKDALAALQDAAQWVRGELNNLLTSDVGKRIARDPLAVMAFIQIRDEPIPSADQVAKKLEVVESILTSVDARLGRHRVEELPSSQQRREVLDACAWAKSRLDRLTDRRDSLRTIIATTSSDGDVSTAPTLDAAIKEYKGRFARLLNEGWQRGEAKAIEGAQKIMFDTAEKTALDQAAHEAQLELEKAKAENQRLKAEHEAELRLLREGLERRLAEMERELAVAKADRQVTQAQTVVVAKKGQEEAAMILKRKKCDDPHTKDVLAPFITKGYIQPWSSTTVDLQPVSLSKLRAVGALDETERGLSMLHKVASNPDTSRPRWGQPLTGMKDLANHHPKQYERTREAQKLLIELGDALVELGMLAP